MPTCTRCNMTVDPRLSVELEDDDGKNTLPAEWTSKALLELAKQLGVMNDFYYPLIGAASMLKNIPATTET